MMNTFTHAVRHRSDPRHTLAVGILTSAAALVVSLAALAMSAILLFSPLAHAEGDPHVPNMAAGYCPGGGMGAQIYLAYCDGEPYPDGTKWHTIQYGFPVIGHPNGLLSPGMQCVNADGSPAGPGGCGGAVK